jgi:hypothetical protein
MRNKKDLPLAILKALEGFVNLKGEKFEFVDPKGALMKVIDTDENSTFAFTIEKYQKHSNGTFQFLMTRSPRNQNENGSYQTWVEIAQLQPQFDAWIKLLDEYDSVDSFFDDPFVKTYSEEFYAEFEIIDEEAHIKPLNTKQILLLDEYLDKLQIQISQRSNETNSSDITEIEKEIKELRENLTSKTKAWVVKRLTKVWAKIAKQGIPYIKEFLSESKKEVIKQGVKGVIEYLKENIHQLGS